MLIEEAEGCTFCIEITGHFFYIEEVNSTGIFLKGKRQYYYSKDIVGFFDASRLWDMSEIIVLT